MSDETRYPFDLGACVVFDVETYPGRWCVGFSGLGRDGKPRVEVAEDRVKLRKILAGIAEGGRTLVGYNSERFDVPVVRAILAGLDPYAIAQAIIRDDSLPVPLAKLPPLGCDHVDLAARLRRGGGFPSLKSVAANLGRPRLRELPYPPDSILTDEQWAEVVAYNAVDLGHTRALLEKLAPELQALASLSEELGQDLRSTGSPRVVEEVFLRAYRDKNGGRKPAMATRPTEVLYRPVAGVRRPRTPEAAAWYDRIVGEPIPVVDRGGVPKVMVPSATFSVGKLRLTVGAGGIHSVDRPRLHYSTRTHHIVSADVGSYYPTLIASKGITPRAYGDVGSAVYQSLLARRLEIKARAKAAADPAERERLDVQANGLKLVLNSTFGKYGDQYSTLFDPGAMIAVTISGQLMLIDLIERLRRAGVRTLSANTDGLFLKVKRGDDRWRKVLNRWQRDTAMSLDVEPLRRFLTLATNRYASLGTDGKLKRKGDGLKGSLSPLNPPNELIVADAVAEALLRDVPPERTVWGCSDPVRFCRITRRSRKVASAALVDDADGSESELPKVSRWYKARGSSRKIVHRFEGGRHTTPAQATEIGLALDVAEGVVPEDVNRSWYVARARKVVQSVPGYRHRSRRLLADQPLAVQAYALGLTPCPKREKAQPAGSDAAAPTFLYDWSRYPTVGTYTGPGTGVLVLDIDDPALFRQWAYRRESPLFRDERERDLRDCLVCVRGEATAEQVRRGEARGKLIFRFEGDAEHPLAALKVDRWRKAKGVEVFYGRGIPSVLGAHPDGTLYRLEGTLGPVEDWIVEDLTPKGKGLVARGRKAAEAERVEVSEECREGLLAELAGIDPKLGRATVGWRTKDLDDGRRIWVGRCPFEHDSGTSTDGDIAAGHAPDGTPYLKCQHASCEESREVNARLRAAHPAPDPRGTPAEAPRAELVPIEPTAIAASMLADLDDGRVALHVAPTGSGKSWSSAQAAAIRYRRGEATLVALPTIRLAEEVLGWLKQFVPEAFEGDAVASIFGGARARLSEDGATEGDGDPDAEGDADGQYPIHEGTRIIVCTHAQLVRRGFSKFARGIWNALEPPKKQGKKGARQADIPPFGIILDEIGEFLREAHREFPLAHRVGSKADPDGSGGFRIPREKCPKSTRSGNCGNCTLAHGGGVPRFNTYGIRELAKIPVIEFDAGGRDLRSLRSPLTVSLRDFDLGELLRIDGTSFVAKVNAFRGRSIGDATRRTAPVLIFTRDPEEDGGGQAPETPDEVLGHMLEFAYSPVITEERPINELGEPIPSRTLAERIAQNDKKWADGIQFPAVTCEVPRLQFTDTLGLELLKRYATRRGAGIVLAGATLGPDDAKILRAVWPRMAEREHPYSDRRIKQVAIVTPDGYHGANALIGPDGKLATAPLEAHGLGLVFCPTRAIAEPLYREVRRHQASVRFASENDAIEVRSYLHTQGDAGTYLTYSRGVLGTGANVPMIRHLLVGSETRRRIGSFNPETVEPAEFARLQAAEQLSVILQNVGRALRGERGKTVVLFVLNADAALRDELRRSPAIVQGSEEPPVLAHGPDLAALVEQAGRWLEADGGPWPEPDPASTTRTKGRPKGTGKRTAEDVYREAEAAIEAGMKWKAFRLKAQPNRTLTAVEMEHLKNRFDRPRAPNP